jgi:O-antigen ligase
MLMALFKHPRFGMLAYLMAFYVHPPSRWWNYALPEIRWSLLASIVTVIAIFLHLPKNPDQRPWLSTRAARLLLLLTAWMWIQNLWGLDAEETFFISVLYGKFLILFYFIYRLADSGENIRWLMLAHLAGCLYLGVVALGTDVSGRLDGVGGPGIDDSNTLSLHLVTGALCGAMLILVERGWRLYFSVVAMAFTLNTIVLCGSRGAFLALVCGFLVLAFLKPAEFKRRFYFLAALGVVMFLFVASATFWNRISALTEAATGATELDRSAEGRLEIIRAQWKMAARYPWGTGHRGTLALSRQYLDDKYLATDSQGVAQTRASHNTFMTALVEHGVPGAIAFIAFVLWGRRAVRVVASSPLGRNPITKSYTAAVAAGLLSLLVSGMFVDCMIVEVTIWLFAILAALESMAFADEQKAQAATVAQP